MIATVAGLGALFIPRGHTAVEPALAGTLLRGKIAPNVSLKDQFGHVTTLSGFRGRPVVVTFMQAHCTDLCPVVAEKISQSLADLGPAGNPVAVLAISADPEHDTPAAVRWFSWKHGMLHRWRYLTGSRRQLNPVWQQFAVYVAPPTANPTIRDLHTSVTYLIDRHGREQVLFASDLNVPALTRDLWITLGLQPGTAGVSTESAPEVQHPAPELDLVTVGGKSLVLGSLRGKVVLLNFWATWCVPCRTEVPFLQRLSQRLKASGLVVLGVDRQEPRSTVLSFLHELHITYPVVLDSGGDASAKYQVNDLPTSFVLDRQSVVRAVRIGVVDEQYVRAHVLALLR